MSTSLPMTSGKDLTDLKKLLVNSSDVAVNKVLRNLLKYVAINFVRSLKMLNSTTNAQLSL